MRLFARLSLIFAAVFGSAGCGGSAGPTPTAGEAAAGRLNAGGSTFVYPMMSKWAAEYDKAKGVQVNYQSIGSGGGIQQMTAKTLQFGCTDSPMNEEQLTKAAESGGEVVHIPLVMGAVVPAYHLDEVKESLVFSGPVLADMFLGKIKKWNDAAIKKLNPSANLPNTDIAVVHRSEGSGTTYIWVEYLSKVSAEWKDKVGVGTSVNWPLGVGQKGNEGVAGSVKRTNGSIGYIELIYALQNKIPFGDVTNAEGVAIKPSLESVNAAGEAALNDIPDDLRFSLTNVKGKNAYPISGTVWAVVYVKQPKANGQAIIDFLKWVTHEGQAMAEPLHYSRLPAGLIQKLEKKLDMIKVEDK